MDVLGHLPHARSTADVNGKVPPLEHSCPHSLYGGTVQWEKQTGVPLTYEVGMKWTGLQGSLQVTMTVGFMETLC